MRSYETAKPLGFAASLLIVVCAVTACSSDDGDDKASSSGESSSGSTNNSSGSTGSNGGAGSSTSCSRELTACTLGSLSDSQQADMCSLMLASIDAPAGAKFECKEGPRDGLSLTVNTKEQCIQQRSPKSCTVTVGELVDCYKSAKKDACAAFADDGPCSVLTATDTGCTP